MFARTTCLFFALFFLGKGVFAQSIIPHEPNAPWVSVGFRAGYNAGASVEGYGILGDFAHGFPLALRLGLSRTSAQPGRAWDARRIFINGNTNGDPEKSGKTWNARFDFMAPFDLLSQARSFVYGGVRRASFTGNFNFVGGNEDFDVKSTNWGLGAGVETYFAVGTNVDFVINGGLDHFFSGTLSGHDTSYSPDGEHVNPREDYTFSDADAAIAQPKWEPVLMMGLSYRF